MLGGSLGRAGGGLVAVKLVEELSAFLLLSATFLFLFLFLFLFPVMMESGRGREREDRNFATGYYLVGESVKSPVVRSGLLDAVLR